MIQALNIPYSSKTDEIMSRYRPIAPKPEFPAPTNANTYNNNNTNNINNYDAPLVPEKFRQSPYLRNIWSHLQARPTRTRKRGRSSSVISPAAASAMLRKQQQQEQHPNLGITATPTFMGLCSPSRPFGLYIDPQQQQQQQQLPINNNNNMVELPLLSSHGNSSKVIDLNKVDQETPTTTTILEERDLLLQLQLQVPTTPSSGRVISPRPVRPVGSSISIVGEISKELVTHQVELKTPDEVEAAVEAEVLPAVISDRNNKVRTVNSAYKELVGQPECLWLDSIMCSGGRISGEVMLNLSNYGLPVSSNGFSCCVKIEWESDGKKKNSVNAHCEVVKLACLSKDYLLSWRFHTREVSPSASKV